MDKTNSNWTWFEQGTRLDDPGNCFHGKQVRFFHGCLFCNQKISLLRNNGQLRPSFHKES